jgi:hypothetical protein
MGNARKPNGLSWVHATSEKRKGLNMVRRLSSEDTLPYKGRYPLPQPKWVFFSEKSLKNARFYYIFKDEKIENGENFSFFIAICKNLLLKG